MKRKTSAAAAEIKRLKDRPSILRSTAFHGAIRIVTFLLGWLFFLPGIGLLVALIATDPIIEKLHIKTSETDMAIAIQFVLGALSFLTGAAFLFVSHLCGAIITRNFYILDLEEIIEKEN